MGGDCDVATIAITVGDHSSARKSTTEIESQFTSTTAHQLDSFRPPLVQLKKLVVLAGCGIVFDRESPRKNKTSWKDNIYSFQIENCS